MTVSQRASLTNLGNILRSTTFGFVTYLRRNVSITAVHDAPLEGLVSLSPAKPYCSPASLPNLSNLLALLGLPHLPFEGVLFESNSKPILNDPFAFSQQQVHFKTFLSGGGMCCHAALRIPGAPPGKLQHRRWPLQIAGGEG